MRTTKLCSMALLLQTALANGGPCQVRVHVSDEYGRAISAVAIKITGAETFVVKPDLPFHIDSGTYLLKVTASGFEPASVQILVDQLDQVVPIALHLSSLEGPEPTCGVYGRVGGGSTVSRVRLIEVFGLRLVDVALGPDRTFNFRGVACGDYVLVLVRSGACIGTLAVFARPATGSLNIQAPDEKEICGPLSLEK